MKVSLTKKPIQPMTTKPAPVRQIVRSNSAHHRHCARVSCACTGSWPQATPASRLLRSPPLPLRLKPTFAVGLGAELDQAQAVVGELPPCAPLYLARRLAPSRAAPFLHCSRPAVPAPVPTGSRKPKGPVIPQTSALPQAAPQVPTPLACAQPSWPPGSPVHV